MLTTPGGRTLRVGATLCSTCDQIRISSVDRVRPITPGALARRPTASMAPTAGEISVVATRLAAAPQRRCTRPALPSRVNSESSEPGSFLTSAANRFGPTAKR